MAAKADVKLGDWWEICCYRFYVPRYNKLLLDIEILQLEHL